MCNPADIQHKIHSFTKDGEHIARFLTETMQGETPGVKVCHRMEATKHLIRYGFPDAVCETTPDRLSRAGGNPVVEGQGGENPDPSPLSPGERARVRGNEIAAPVTHLDILNYQIAHLIRHETAEGHTVVEFLIHIMTGKDRPFTPGSSASSPQTAWQQQENSCDAASATSAHAASPQTPPTKQTPTTPCTQT